jgi:dCTP deaminase
MGVLVDWQIRQRVRDYGMIEPFTDYDSCPPGVISYGLSSMGYDLRIGTRFKVYSDARPTVVDPKRIDVHSYINIETEEPLPIPPNSYVLGESVELFRIPRDILVTIIGRSTYARACILVNVTPGEPEWIGVWTIEISNSTRLPVYIYPNEGIAQAIFHRADNPERLCDRSYADKKGKYQNQAGVTLPIVR